MPSQIQYTEKEREKRDLVDVDAENDFYHHFNFPLFGLRGESVKNEKMSELFFVSARVRTRVSDFVPRASMRQCHTMRTHSVIFTHIHTPRAT